MYGYTYTRSVWVHVQKVCLYGYMYTRSVCMGTRTQGLSVWVHVQKVGHSKEEAVVEVLISAC